MSIWRPVMLDHNPTHRKGTYVARGLDRNGREVTRLAQPELLRVYEYHGRPKPGPYSNLQVDLSATIRYLARHMDVERISVEITLEPLRSEVRP